tara:strand:+ start:192 stop:425 length:234 start_codon:yes stop_codon:yes gene_type:complete
MTMQLKTRVLVKGKATWRLTRFSDELFIAKNGFGKQHVFRCQAEVENFEDFLVRNGFSLRETGRSLETIKRVPQAVA